MAAGPLAQAARPGRPRRDTTGVSGGSRAAAGRRWCGVGTDAPTDAGVARLLDDAVVAGVLADWGRRFGDPVPGVVVTLLRGVLLSVAA
ncbi:MAG: hypothetical protein JWO60_1774, partial [Frankiales bacterium]|nr:hypothetical protein [Frankiales bacterium]